LAKFSPIITSFKQFFTYLLQFKGLIFVYFNGKYIKESMNMQNILILINFRLHDENDGTKKSYSSVVTLAK